MLFGLSFLAGPAVAGWLLAVLPAIDVVWVTAGCSAVAALAIGVMPLRPTAIPTGADTSVLAGLIFIRRSRPLLAMLIISLGTMVLVGPLLSIVLPAFFTTLAAPGLLGLSLSAYAIGTMAGSALYGWVFAGRQWAAWVTANLLYVVSGVLIATLSGFWVVAAGMLAAGLGSGLLQPIVTVVLTEHVPDAVRGRVFGSYSAMTMVVAPVGLGLMSLVLNGTDLGTGAWALAVGWLLVAVYALVAPGLRDYIRPEREGANADHRPTG